MNIFSGDFVLVSRGAYICEGHMFERGCIRDFMIDHIEMKENGVIKYPPPLTPIRNTDDQNDFKFQ